MDNRTKPVTNNVTSVLSSDMISNSGLDKPAESGISDNNEETVPKIKKLRMNWTADLHQKFVIAVEQSGGLKGATPKKILKVMTDMEVEGLDRGIIGSYLQKYRQDPTRNRFYHHQAQSQLQCQPHPQQQPQSQPQLQLEPQPQPQLQLEPQPQPQLQLEPQLPPQLELESPPQLQLESPPQPLPQLQLEPQPQLQLQPHTQLEPQWQWKTQSQPQTQLEPQRQWETQLQPQTQFEPQRQLETQLQPQTQFEPQWQCETQLQPQLQSQPQSQSLQPVNQYSFPELSSVETVEDVEFIYQNPPPFDLCECFLNYDQYTDSK